MNYTIEQSSSPTKIEGDIFTEFPPEKEITFFTIWSEDEPLGQVALVERSTRWWVDYAFIRKDMRSKGVYALLINELHKLAVQHTDTLWVEVINKRPEDYDTPPPGLDLPKTFVMVIYKGVPIAFERWPEFQRKHNITDRQGIKTLFFSDLRPLRDGLRNS